MKDLSLFEKEINLFFKNKDLLKQALIHRSYLNEHPQFYLGHNERLEFLGDAVLELITTKYLFNNFNRPEGDLTSFRSSLVNTKTLFKVAKKLKLDRYLFLSHGEARSNKNKAREVILANAFEALIGAIYLDQGFDKAEEFIQKHLIPYLKTILEKQTYKDPKSKFQEFTQGKLKITPVYRVMSEKGPDHEKIFVVGAFLNEKLIARGSGRSKQEAEVKAAENAIRKICPEQAK